MGLQEGAKIDIFDLRYFFHCLVVSDHQVAVAFQRRCQMDRIRGFETVFGPKLGRRIGRVKRQRLDGKIGKIFEQSPIGQGKFRPI